MVSAAKNKAKKIIDQAGVIDSKGGGDTVRVWESYREQALLWRSIALIQVPATIIALVFALVMLGKQDITLKVPAKPLPGIYAAQEIPDTEFIEHATEFVNLIASYQPQVARRQFVAAADFLVEPALSVYKTQMLGAELSTIETTNRTQIFFVDPSKTLVTRLRRGRVKVELTGDRMKIIAGKKLKPVSTRFSITMRTHPRNRLNPFGIVVESVTHANLSRRGKVIES